MAGILGDSRVRLGVIVCAAGRSSRFQVGGESALGSRSKLDEDLGGKPVLQRAIELFHTRDETAAIVVAGPADDDAFALFNLRHADKIALFGGSLCRGGARRSESVRNALALIPDDCTHIAVHDGARACTPGDLIDRVLDAACAHGAAIPAIAIGDTIKRAGETREAPANADPIAAILGVAAGGSGGGAGGSGVVRLVGETVEREGLLAAQTPQIFEAGLLRRAYAQADLSGSDDAQLVERLGEPVAIVEGDPRNIKITLPDDVAIARAILGLKGPEGRPIHKRF